VTYVKCKCKLESWPLKGSGWKSSAPTTYGPRPTAGAYTGNASDAEQNPSPSAETPRPGTPRNSPACRGLRGAKKLVGFHRFLRGFGELIQDTGIFAGISGDAGRLGLLASVSLQLRHPVPQSPHVTATTTATRCPQREGERFHRLRQCRGAIAIDFGNVPVHYRSLLRYPTVARG
jgi:hypothetical protein